MTKHEQLRYNIADAYRLYLYAHITNESVGRIRCIIEKFLIYHLRLIDKPPYSKLRSPKWYVMPLVKITAPEKVDNVYDNAEAIRLFKTQIAIWYRENRGDIPVSQSMSLTFENFDVTMKWWIAIEEEVVRLYESYRC